MDFKIDHGIIDAASRLSQRKSTALRLEIAQRAISEASKDGSRREQRSFVRYAIIATVLCLFFLCVKKDSLITWISSGISLHRQNRLIEKYEAENAALEDRIRQLTDDRDSLERFAREELQFAAPGDDVYVIPEK